MLAGTAIWLQADSAGPGGGDRARCGGGVSGDQEQAVAFWRLDDGELRFADEQRPGERADVIVAGTLTGPLAKHPSCPPGNLSPLPSATARASDPLAKYN